MTDYETNCYECSALLETICPVCNATRVAELERALAFYADRANHIAHRDLTASVYIETSAIDTDGGKLARAALGYK